MVNKTKEFVRHILLRLNNKSSKGYTSFAPLKIAPEYTNIDLENKQVTGIVKHNDKIYLTVIVDIKLNKTLVKGSLRGICHITKPFNKGHYIAMIKSHAEMLLNKED
ncbi:hypothetical protein ACQCT3_15895 [Sutcliffiella horikoshii]|uniref:hypothetical protein n=1 Tax=Bacillaceae TaxID=186817 RepID=UPI0001E89676|nr:hypothetical protein [Bacillus sp. m3-13]